MNPLFVLAIGVVSVSTSAIFVKLISAPPGIIAFYRLLFSVVLMMPIFLLKYVHEIRHITSKDWLFSIIAGIFLAFHFILWFESLQYTSVASSTVLVALQPIFAFIGTYLFFKEKTSWKSILSTITAIGGCIIISWGDFLLSEKALYGDLLALIACGLVTGYLLFGQTVRQRVSLITYTFIVYSISTLTLFIYVMLNKQPLYPYQVNDWIFLILLALFPTLLGHTLFNWSVKYLSTSVISMATLFEPVGAAILAYFVLQERIAWSQIFGGLFVIVGLSSFLIDKRRRRKKRL